MPSTTTEKGCLIKAFFAGMARSGAHLQAMGSVLRITQRMVMQTGIKGNMPALQKPTFIRGI